MRIDVNSDGLKSQKLTSTFDVSRILTARCGIEISVLALRYVMRRHSEAFPSLLRVGNSFAWPEAAVDAAERYFRKAWGIKKNA